MTKQIGQNNELISRYEKIYGKGWKFSLNLGSGKDYKSIHNGWINVDNNKKYDADIYYDLNNLPYPFKDEQFECIYCAHILEHLDDLFKTLKELYRILQPNGVIHIRVPHFSNGNGYNDLSHKRFFGWFSFQQIIDGYYNEEFKFKIISQRFNFVADNRKIANLLFSWFYNLMPKQFYERFLCWIFPIGEIELKLIKEKK